jgi:hypothetical protein
MIEVKGSERKDNKKGPWLVIQYLNDKGESKETNVFDKKVIEQFTGPGKYEATWVQNGKYWNLAGLSLVSGNGSGSGNGHRDTYGSKAQESTVSSPPGNNRVSVAIACVQAAASVFKAQQGIPPSELADAALLLTRGFIRECDAYINGQAVSVAPAAPQSAEGA